MEYHENKSVEGFKWEFALFLEGVKVPFYSASISTADSGTNANIGLYTSKFIRDIKPKTSVQIFFKDVYKGDGAWRIMFDGYVSGLTDSESIVNGRILYLRARDFTFDLDKLPAAVTFSSIESLGNYQESVDAGFISLCKIQSGKIKVNGLKKYDDSGTDTIGNIGFGANSLSSVNIVLERIITSATGTGKFHTNLSKNTSDTSTKTKTKDGTAKSNNGKVALKTSYNKRMEIFRKYTGMADVSFVLDALARGLMSDAVSESVVAMNVNARMRSDKKIAIPKSKATYLMFDNSTNVADFGAQVMGNSRYSSVYAVLQRTASLAQARHASCSTPTCIDVSDPEVREYFIDDAVYKNLIQRESFGGKYILNQASFLPPIDFSSPPTCNIITPVMYNSVVGTLDFDRASTRGIFEVHSIFSNTEGFSGGENEDINLSKVYSPSMIIPSRASVITKGKCNDSRYPIITKKSGNYLVPPLSEEEMYSGVKVYYSQVDSTMAKATTITSQVNTPEATKEAIQDSEAETIVDDSTLDSTIAKEIKESAAVAVKTANTSATGNNSSKDTGKERYKTNLQRQAMIKFIYSKYMGSNVQVSMVFNPYLIEGYPAILVADESVYDAAEMKDLIGVIKHVTHTISISGGTGVASTNVLLAGVRSVKQPTHINEDGQYLYSKRTNSISAEIDPNTLEYKHGHLQDAPKPRYNRDSSCIEDGYFIKKDSKAADHIYAKDVLTMDKESAELFDDQFLIDREYTPNYIERFYKKALKVENRFMVGINVNGKPYMYDTIDEALDRFKANNPSIYTSLRSSMKLAYREICSADEFYGGILGASVAYSHKIDETKYKTHYKVVKNDSSTRILHNEEPFRNKARLRDKYYGIDTLTMSKLNKDDKNYYTVLGNKPPISKEGDLSSIREIIPYTPFVKERRKTIEDYLKYLAPTTMVEDNK